MNHPSSHGKSGHRGVVRHAIPLERVASVLLLMDATQPLSEVEEIKTFGHEMRKKGKEVVFLTFHPLKKLTDNMQPNEMYKLCCKGDFGLRGRPRSKNLKELLGRHFDLLINCCLNGNRYLKTISERSSAAFRLGPYRVPEDVAFYEMLVWPNGANLCENYLIEAGRVLQKIVA